MSVPCNLLILCSLLGAVFTLVYIIKCLASMYPCLCTSLSVCLSLRGHHGRWALFCSMVAQVCTCVHVLYCMYIYPCAVPSLNKDVTYLLTFKMTGLIIQPSVVVLPYFSIFLLELHNMWCATWNSTLRVVRHKPRKCHLNIMELVTRQWQIQGVQTPPLWSRKNWGRGRPAYKLNTYVSAGKGNFSLRPIPRLQYLYFMPQYLTMKRSMIRAKPHSEPA